MNIHAGKLSLVLVAALSASAWGAGFEKSVSWSGRYAGLGGAATASVDDAQSLYFNPAGLAQVQGIEFAGNLSPTLSKFNGPIVSSGVALEGKQSFSPLFGAFIGYQLSPGLVLGMGSYVAGGSRSKFESVDFTARNILLDTLRPTVETDVKIIEYSAGLGYEVCEGLRVGAAWRMTQVDARFSSAVTNSGDTALIHLAMTRLQDMRYNGVRLGVQFAPKDSPWSLGLSYRSTLGFIAKGDTSGTVETSATNSTAMAGTTGTAEIAGYFPMQLSLGSAYRLNAHDHVALDWVFTRYALNRVLDVNGAATVPAGILGAGAVTLNPTDIDLHWTNQHNLRLGYEKSLGDRLRARGGYVITSQVTQRSLARATIASPGLGHTLIAGMGKTLITQRLDLDFALEYSFASGSGTYVEKSSSFSRDITGDFSSRAFVGHAGVRYRF